MAAPADTPTILESEATLICERPDGEGPIPPAELADHPRYRLLRLLGAGGMGTVWLAEHKMMRRQVALKVIRPEFLARADAAERFQREVQVAAHLHHPHIVAAHDAEQAGATHFLVMEYVAGESLAERLKRNGPLPVAEACRLARDVALGLQHAHKHGLVHRDIKPHNLMLAAEGVVKILDFGLAAFVSGSVPAAGLTGVNMVVGTPDYIAPEQAEDARAADIRSDIYSLGCTLYEMLTGRVPFPGVAFTPDSKQLLSGAADATLRLWDVASGRPVRILRGHTDLVVGVAVSPDGRWAVSGAHDRTLRLWELASGREVRKFEGHMAISDGMFSADSKQVLSWSGDRSVWLWDVASGKQLHLYQGHTGWIWGAYFLNERQIASWSAEDHTVRVWDIAREKELRCHALKQQKLEGLDVSPDGRTYLAAYNDQTVCLYDMATGKELAVTRAANRPDVLTISSDGRYAAAGSNRGLVHLWRLPDEPADPSEP
jgi:tRNA A-37 threonylcarbamoyl transferase component Bud32